MAQDSDEMVNTRLGFDDFEAINACGNHRIFWPGINHSRPRVNEPGLALTRQKAIGNK